MATIQLDDGTDVTQPKEIMNCQKLFYQNLYSQPKIDLLVQNEAKEHFLTQDNVPTVQQQDKESLESPVQLCEIANAVHDLPNSKTPGTDGIPIDFYKVFWGKIKYNVLDSINYAIEQKCMSIDQRRGVLSLIPKKGKDSRKLKNWRPISLLNSDYKILAKAIATRLQQVLPYLISCDQSGCLKGRSTYANIRSTIDVINYVNENHAPGILAYIDFEKAFDTVNWHFMYQTLEAMNFGPNFIGYIKTMYHEIESCVMNNGHTSGYFKLTRGIRQGCPMSAYLFILLVESMANAIKNNPNIRGININHERHKISQYADDTCLYLEDQNSLKTALQIFEKFSKCSGLKVNRDKSEAIWIGASSNFRHKPLGLRWTTGATYLGIYISNDVNEISIKNFKDKLDSIKELLNMWTLRKLTIKGKIQVINTLIISQLLYPSTVLAMPKKYVEEYNKEIIKFIWDQKPSKVKYTSLINTIENGGLKLQDLQCKVDSLKIKWIKQLEETEYKSPWKNYLEYKFRTKCEDIPHYNLDTANYPIFHDRFYIELFDAWNKVRANKIETYEDICRQCIWNNRHIKVNHKVVNYKNWINSGIKYIGNLIDENGTIRTKEMLEQEFGLNCQYLQYQSIKAAIPRQWKVLIKQNKGLVCFDDTTTDCAIKIGKTYRNIKEISTRDVYWHLLENLSQRPTSEKKWNK
jgi:hypothetical protein